MKPHAKGPWEWSENLLVSQEPQYDVVLRLHANFQPLKADAALVAAAPELLAALEEILACCQDEQCGEKHPCGNCHTARKAIAEAKGEPINE